MNNCFTKDGHITKQAYALFLSGDMCEKSRLEIAEHLSFCDECIEHFVLAIGQEALVSPPNSTRSSIIKTIYARVFNAVFNKYTAYIAAACIAFVLWGTGVSTNIAKVPAQLSDYAFGIRTQREMNEDLQRRAQGEEDGGFQFIANTIDNFLSKAQQ